MRAQNTERRVNGQGEKQRAQSETIGFVLLFSLVLIGAGAIIAFGAVAVSDSQNSLSADRAEKVMTQMDSEISMVALGRTNSQEMEFDRASGSDFTVDEEAGTINITTIGGDENTVVMPDTDLGAVIFERANTKIAYQGGGVWRTDGSEGSGMVSPPEFNYRDQTLTLPLVTISGDRSLNGGAVVEKDGPSTSYFPNVSKDENLTNPLEDEIVQVTVESRYHQGWKAYFETRTEGDVTHEPDEQRVRVNLTAPAVVDFQYGAITTKKDGLTSQNNGVVIGDEREGTDAQSVSENVNSEASDCESCSTESTFDSTVTAGRYYAEDGLDVNDGTVFDTSDGDIEVTVEDDISFNSNKKSPTTIEGDGQVRFYVNGTVSDIELNGWTNADENSDSDDLVMFVHSDVDSIDMNGKKQFNGFIYAPNSEFGISGGGGASKDDNIVGSVVAETIDVNNGGIVHENENNLAVEVGGRTNPLTFLHISTNPVTVTSP